MLLRTAGRLKIQLDEDKIQALKREVKKRGCLWNPDHEHYYDRYSIMVAWDEIAKTLDIPEDVARMKWKNLRDLFKKEARKHNFSSAEEYTGKWRHFKSLSFLHIPSDNTKNDDNTEENSSAADDTGSNYSKFNQRNEMLIKREPLECSEVEVFVEGQDNFEGPVEEPTNKRRKSSADDYDLLFLKSLTPYFKQLDPLRKLVVRSKVQELLYTEIAEQSALNNSK